MREYYYLISSFPMLNFDSEMPFTYEEFLKKCEDELSTNDIDIIRRVSLGPYEDINDNFNILREWKIFTRELYNEIVRHRAVKKSQDASKYIRGENYPNPFLKGFSEWVVSEESPIEAEKSIDKFKWGKIEDMAKGHYFDIEYLVSYALRLQILERWSRINSHPAA